MAAPNSELWASVDGAIGVHIVREEDGLKDIALFFSDRTGADAIILGKQVSPYSTLYALRRAEPVGNGLWPRPREFNRRVGTATLVKLDTGKMWLNLIDFSPEGTTVSPALPPITQGYELVQVTA